MIKKLIYNHDSKEVNVLWASEFNGYRVGIGKIIYPKGKEEKYYCYRMDEEKDRETMEVIVPVVYYDGTDGEEEGWRETYESFVITGVLYRMAQEFKLIDE